MSFILDALKKVERDKRNGGGSRSSEMMAASRGGVGSGRHRMSMAVIAVVSAAATAALVSFLSGRGAMQSPTGADDPGAFLTPPREASIESAPAVLIGSEGEPTGDRVGARAPLPTIAQPTTREPAKRAPVADAASREMPEPVEPIEEPEPTEGENAPVQTIRLVGRERVMLGGVQSEDLDSPEGTEDEEGDSLPPDFPKLVLQGTSVLGGSSVAVISDQRVFVGDRVEGALVVRIDEREVELEIDGRRFTLRL